jgi:surface antigen
MKMRTTKPSNNKYYIRLADGGYNGAIQGKPTDKTANVLSNCVGYANGRFNEIIDAGKCKYQLTCNAENFIERAKELGLKVSKTPVLGGIMVWQKGNTLSNKDGAGHVAVVEKIIDDNTIYTSESAWGGKAFYNCTRNNSNGRWGIGSAYKFRGCIINPAVKETAKTDKTVAQIAKEVIEGKWGNGAERKRRLIQAGYNYTEVQNKVNELAKGKAVTVGAKVRIKKGANQYGTTRDFASKVYNTTYKVVEIRGNRVVFATTDGKTVMGAVSKNDCIVQ